MAVLSGVPARAADPALAARAEQIVREVLATDPARGTRPGMLISRIADGPDTLAARNHLDRFTPASLQKLPVTAAALMRFGPDHRFTTRVLVKGRRPDGTVGKLILVGGGDPTLATSAYRERYLTRREGMSKDGRLFESGSPSIGDIARAIAGEGITGVRDNLLADDSLFDRRRTQDGWKSSYLNDSTGGPHVGLISALAVDQGFSNLGKTAIASSPTLFAARKLRDSLARRDIRVDGDVVGARAPDDALDLIAVKSPPLEQIVRWVNRWSANHPAELLLKGLGAAFGDDGSTAEGRRVVKRALRNAGIDTDGFALKDGSGLSLDDRMTPRMIGQILRWALDTDDGAARAMRRSLAVACKPGTLLYRMCGTKADANLRGKTGLVTDVRAMAGWVRGTDDVRTIYVAVFNRASDEASLTSTLNLLGRRLAAFP